MFQHSSKSDTALCIFSFYIMLMAKGVRGSMYIFKDFAVFEVFGTLETTSRG